MSYAFKFRGADVTATLHNVKDYREDVRRPYYARGRGGIVGYGAMKLQLRFADDGAYVEAEQDSSGPRGTLTVDELSDDAGAQEALLRGFASALGEGAGAYHRRPTHAERVVARREYGALARALIARVGPLDPVKVELLVAVSMQIALHQQELDLALGTGGVAPGSPAATENVTALVRKYDALLYCVRDLKDWNGTRTP